MLLLSLLLLLLLLLLQCHGFSSPSKYALHLRSGKSVVGALLITSTALMWLLYWTLPPETLRVSLMAILFQI